MNLETVGLPNVCIHTEKITFRAFEPTALCYSRKVASFSVQSIVCCPTAGVNKRVACQDSYKVIEITMRALGYITVTLLKHRCYKTFLREWKAKKLGNIPFTDRFQFYNSIH